MAVELPSVLILGGVNTVARHLVTYLCGDEGENTSSDDGDYRPLVKFLRLADRFSVEPATTYLDQAFRRCLKRKDLFQYRQTNLAVAAKSSELFTPPPGIPAFDYIFDLTGETRPDRPEIIHLQQSYNLPVLLARHAASTQHKAYIRLAFPYYTMSNSLSGGYTERFVDVSDKDKKDKKGGLFRSRDKGSDGLGPKPDDIRGRWWHESVRTQGSIAGLNYAAIRIAETYGEGFMEGQVLARLVIAHIYKFKNDEMKFLHNPDLRLHTIHVKDIARGLFQAAKWMRAKGKVEALSLAGEDMPSAWEWSKGKDAEHERQGQKLAQDLLAETEKVRVPYFNLVDDGDTTQDNLARACSEVFKVKYGFHNAMISSLVSSFNRTDFTHLVDDINEDHMEAWQEMMTKSSPPILDTSISPFLTEDSFRKKAINLNGAKFRTTVGWQPSVPRVNPLDLRLQAEAFQNAQLWQVQCLRSGLTHAHMTLTTMDRPKV